jgi:methionyl aminopeptidase
MMRDKRRTPSMGRIIYKNHRDLEKMREAGAVVSHTLAALRDAVRPGVTTLDLDRLAYDIIRKAGGWPSFLGYRKFPASICASVDEEVVHGIPSRTRVLKEGQIVKLDVGVRLRGFHADSALTVPVGDVDPEVARLLQVTRASLWKGIQAITFRGRLHDVSGAIQRHVEAAGFSIVKDMVGHGVGKDLHEEPQVANYVNPEHANPLLLEGMTLAIEPMVNLGGEEIEILADEWTAVTSDRSPSAHYEHTVAVTRTGFDVLTLGPHDPGP